MPNILANIAKMESATTGTGTLTLGAAVTGYLPFASAGVTNGQVVTYAIEDYDVSGNIIAREVGAGTYSSTGPTLTRDTVYSSTNAGAKINCSGLQYVFVSLAKEDLATFGVLSAVNTWTANNYFTTGNVGIGTTSPSDKLVVYGTSAPAMRAQDATSFTQIYTNGGTGVLNNAGTGSLQFWNNGSERVRIDATGNVGIGTAGPSGSLHTVGTTAIFLDRAGATASHLLLRTANGTVSSPTAILNTNNLGRISFQGYDGTQWASNSTAGVAAFATENWSTTARGSQLQFLTTPNTTVAAVERMIIDQAGNVSIGSSAAKTRLQASAATTLNAPVLGSATNAPFYVTNSDSAYGLLVGTSTSGDAWLQAQRTDGTATAYNINLNPVGGNVGIGTASPDARFHILSPVLGGTAGNTQRHQRLNSLTSGGSPNSLLLDITARRHTTGTDWIGTNVRVQRTIDATAQGFIDFGIDLVSSSGGLGFGTGTTTHMSMDNSGNVGIGIGTASPSAPLHVERNQAAETALFINNTNASGYSAVRVGPSDRGTNGDGLLYSSTTATGLRSGTRPLVFETGSGSERMRLHTTGGVSINSTTDPGAGITAINSTLQIYRQNTSGEGGELRLCRSGDNAVGWYIDLVGTATGTDPNTLRFVDAPGAASRLELSSRGVLYIVNDLGPGAGDTLALGFRGAPHNDQTGTTYTFARTDAGRAVMFKGTANATWTVPLSTATDFPIGTMIILDNSHAIHSSLTVVVQGADGVGIRAANGAVESTTARLINRQLSRGSIATLRKLANRGSTQTVNSITFVGTTATATTAVAHGYNVGDFVEIAGAVQSQYNGTQRINTVGSTTTFTYVMSAAPATNATGTITVRSADLWNITGSFSVV